MSNGSSRNAWPVRATSFRADIALSTSPRSISSTLSIQKPCASDFISGKYGSRAAYPSVMRTGKAHLGLRRATSTLSRCSVWVFTYSSIAPRLAAASAAALGGCCALFPRNGSSASKRGQCLSGNRRSPRWNAFQNSGCCSPQSFNKGMAAFSSSGTVRYFCASALKVKGSPLCFARASSRPTSI